MLSPDSTILPTEMEVDWRTPNLTPTDPWRKLNQQESNVVFMPNGAQFSVLIPTPPGSARVLKTLYLLAEQV